MKYSVLGLDQSMRATGWAHLCEGDPQPTYGVNESPSWGDNEGCHLWRWGKWLDHMVNDRGVSHVFFENTFISVPGYVESLSQCLARYCLIGKILEVAYEHGIAARMASIADWRRHFTGHKRPPKDIKAGARRAWWKKQAIAACQRNRWRVDDHNAAEALGILYFGISTIDPKFAAQRDPIFYPEPAS